MGDNGGEGGKGSLLWFGKEGSQQICAMLSWALFPHPQGFSKWFKEYKFIRINGGPAASLGALGFYRGGSAAGTYSRNTARENGKLPG